MATATTADTFQALICSRIFVLVTDLTGRLPVALGAQPMQVLWLVLRRPDTRPQPAVATPAVREMPATRVHAAYRRAA